jgi:hypothetical protein
VRLRTYIDPIGEPLGDPRADAGLPWEGRKAVRVESLTGAAWDPSLLPNVKLWWRGDLGITLGTGGVTQWADQINGETMSPIDTNTSRRPDVVSRGGNQALEFTNPTGLAGAFSTVSFSQPATWVIVREFSTTTGTQAYFSGDNGAPSSERNAFLYFDNASREAIFAGATRASGLTPSGQQAVAGLFNGASSAIYIDDLTTAAASGNAGSGVPLGAQAGMQNNGAFFEGWLWEIIGVDGAFPSGSDLTSLGDYLSARYAGLSLTY